MSLSWYVDEVQDYKEVCWHEDGTLNPVTHSLIFATIAVGLGRITEQNADEFFARLRVIEKLDGYFMHQGDGKPYLLTTEDVRQHIGLRTNVTDETRPKWLKRVFSGSNTSIMETLARQYRRETKPDEVPA